MKKELWQSQLQCFTFLCVVSFSRQTAIVFSQRNWPGQERHRRRVLPLSTCLRTCRATGDVPVRRKVSYGGSYSSGKGGRKCRLFLHLLESGAAVNKVKSDVLCISLGHMMSGGVWVVMLCMLMW